MYIFCEFSFEIRFCYEEINRRWEVVRHFFKNKNILERIMRIACLTEIFIHEPRGTILFLGRCIYM